MSYFTVDATWIHICVLKKKHIIRKQRFADKCFQVIEFADESDRMKILKAASGLTEVSSGG